MKNNSTIESLKAMRFSAMAAELERQMDDSSTYSHMGFEERLSLLVDAEWNSRQNNKLIRCIRDARFAEPGAVVEDIEYHEDRHLDKAQFLRFATCGFINKRHHIIFKGASGNGKTFLACAIGNAACRKLKAIYPPSGASGGAGIGAGCRRVWKGIEILQKVRSADTG